MAIARQVVTVSPRRLRRANTRKYSAYTYTSPSRSAITEERTQRLKISSCGSPVEMLDNSSGSSSTCIGVRAGWRGGGSLPVGTHAKTVTTAQHFIHSGGGRRSRSPTRAPVVDPRLPTGEETRHSVRGGSLCSAATKALFTAARARTGLGREGGSGEQGSDGGRVATHGCRSGDTKNHVATVFVFAVVSWWWWWWWGANCIARQIQLSGGGGGVAVVHPTTPNK